MSKRRTDEPRIEPKLQTDDFILQQLWEEKFLPEKPRAENVRIIEKYVILGKLRANSRVIFHFLKSFALYAKESELF